MSVFKFRGIPAAIMALVSLLALCVVNVRAHQAVAASTPPVITRMANGQWFVPSGSGLGPPLAQVKAFVLYNGDVCLHVPLRPVASMDQIIGLLCVPKPHEAITRVDASYRDACGEANRLLSEDSVASLKPGSRYEAKFHDCIAGADRQLAEIRTKLHVEDVR